MQLDFWNNPIVVSAFRVKYRRGGFSTGLGAYLLVLAAAGVGLQYYQDKLRVPWHHIYYPLLMGVQFFVSGLIAATATASSVRSEVINRTLDFQRIAALSPRQIILGKLLGEPAMAYLLAIGTIPLALWCYLSGGVAFEVMVGMYVNLATTTLLCGAAGLICRLERPVNQVAGAFMSVFAMASPIPLFVALAQRRPWDFGPELFGIKFPLLLLMPPVQLLVAILCFQVMVRQLINPLNTLVGKGMAYGILAAIDVLTSALIFDWGPFALSLGQRAAWFCLVHLLVSLGLTMVMTPWRETIYSWVWRFRGRPPRLWDLWVGDRSENGLALLTFCGIGMFNLWLLVLLPGIRIDGPNELNQAIPIVLPAVAMMVLLTLTFGTIHQWLVLVGGRAVNPFLIILVIIATVGPPLLGLDPRLEKLTPLSPGTHFVYWTGGPKPAFNSAPLLGGYCLILFLTWLALRRRLRLIEKWIAHKLRQMGVPQPAPKSLAVQPDSLSLQKQQAQQ